MTNCTPATVHQNASTGSDSDLAPPELFAAVEELSEREVERFEFPRKPTVWVVCRDPFLWIACASEYSESDLIEVYRFTRGDISEFRAEKTRDSRAAWIGIGLLFMLGAVGVGVAAYFSGRFYFVIAGGLLISSIGLMFKDGTTARIDIRNSTCRFGWTYCFATNDHGEQSKANALLTKLDPWAQDVSERP